jgi:hypothetical protein
MQNRKERYSKICLLYFPLLHKTSIVFLLALIDVEMSRAEVHSRLISCYNFVLQRHRFRISMDIQKSLDPYFTH